MGRLHTSDGKPLRGSCKYSNKIMAVQEEQNPKGAENKGKWGSTGGHDKARKKLVTKANCKLKQVKKQSEELNQMLAAFGVIDQDNSGCW